MIDALKEKARNKGYLKKEPKVAEIPEQPIFIHNPEVVLGRLIKADAITNEELEKAANQMKAEYTSELINDIMKVHGIKMR